jgi:hypothetical protein
MKRNLSTKTDYENAVLAVREVIHAWDPYSLLAGGAPSDEFDGEIEKLVAKIRTISSEKDASESVKEVFNGLLGEESSNEEYELIGKRLFGNLVKKGVLVND